MDGLVQFLRDRLEDDLEEVKEYDGSWNDVDGCWGVHLDPARVLAEVEAKRRALDHYQAVRNHAKNDPAYVLAEGAVAKQIQIMAAPYADHPDYRKEWRP